MSEKEIIKPSSVIEVWKSKGFIIGVILVLIMAHININMKLWYKTEYVEDNFFTGWCGPEGLYSWPYMSSTPLITALFIPMMILVVIGALAKSLRLSAKDYAIISAMAFATAWIPLQQHGAHIQPLVAYHGIMLHGEPYSTLAAEAFHPLWSPLVGLTPEDPLYKGLLYGGMAPPWGIWAGTIALWFVHALAYYFTGIFLMTLLRRSWIDVEELPFPVEAGLTRLIKEASTYEEGRRVPNLLRNKWLWLGFLTGWIVTTPRWLHSLFPATFPLPPGGTFPGYGGALLNLTFLNLIKNAWIVITLIPGYMGLGALTPLSVSTSIVIFTILFWVILPPIFTAAGWFPPEPGADNWGGPMWASSDSAHPLFYTYPALTFGFTFAMLVWPLIVLRDQYKTLFKSMYQKLRDGEEGEALSYRKLWAGLVISFCVWVGVWIATGARASQVLLIYIYLTIFFVATARLHAEGAVIHAYPYEEFASEGVGEPMALLPLAQAVGPVNDIPAFRAFYWNEQINFESGISNQFTPTISTLKIADHTKTHARDIFITICTIVPIVMLFSLYYAFTNAYTYGIEKDWQYGCAWATGWTTWIAIDSILVNPGTGNVYGVLPTPKVGVEVLLAFIVGILISYLRIKYAKLRFISLAGLIVALITRTGVFIWFPILIGNIIRRVMFRIGGGRLWEDIGAPLAVGLLVSGGAVMFLVGICKWIPGITPPPLPTPT